MERLMPSAISYSKFIIIKWYPQHKNYGCANMLTILFVLLPYHS